MGENIVMELLGSYFFWIPLAIGIVWFFAFLSVADYNAKIPAKAVLIYTLIGIALFAAAIPVNKAYDYPTYKASEDAALEKLQMIEGAYQQPFYLKESSSEMGVQGEIKGSVGGFLLIAGNVYGRIDSGRIITVVYEDNDPLIDRYTNVHRSISFPLDKAVITTIPKGEKPYISYPEARIQKVDRPLYELSLHLIPGAPHLYLPAGWKIL